MHLIPTFRSDFKVKYILAITSIHFPRFSKILRGDGCGYSDGYRRGYLITYFAPVS